MKKKTLSLLTIVLSFIIVSTIIFSGCNKDQTVDTDKTKYEQWISSAPTVTGDVTALTNTENSPAGAYSMIMTAIDNIPKVDFSATFFESTAKTVVLGSINVEQAVKTISINDNKNKESYTYTGSATSKSTAGISIKVFEETYVNSDGTVNFRTPTDTKKMVEIKEDGMVGVTDDVEFDTQTYNSVEEFNTARNASSGTFGAYIFSEEAIVSAEVSHDDELGFYTVSWVLDPEISTPEYAKLMKSMLPKNSTVAFQNLKMTFEIWDCGLIRRHSIEEDYDMKILGVINGNVAMSPVVYYTYDSTQYNIADYRFN